MSGISFQVLKPSSLYSSLYINVEFSNSFLQISRTIKKTTNKGTSRGVRLRFWWNWNMLKRIKKNEIRVFFYRPENGLRGWKLPPKFALKNNFFFNISENNYIFLVKRTPKYFLKKAITCAEFLFRRVTSPIFV